MALSAVNESLGVPLTGQGPKRTAHVVVHLPQRSVGPQQPNRSNRPHERDTPIAGSLVVDVTGGVIVTFSRRAFYERSNAIGHVRRELH